MEHETIVVGILGFKLTGPLTQIIARIDVNVLEDGSRQVKVALRADYRCIISKAAPEVAAETTTDVQIKELINRALYQLLTEAMDVSSH